MRSVLYVLTGVLCLSIPPVVTGQDTAADILPGSTAVYLEVQRPGELLKEIKDHPLLREIKKSESGERLLTHPNFVQFQVVLSLFELRLGMTWEEAIEAISAQGVAIGIDPETNGVALLLKGESAEKVEQVRKQLMEIAREEAKKNGKTDPYKQTDYRGITVYQVDKGGFATHGPWIMAVNKGDLGQKLLDQVLDGGRQNLSANPEFQNASASRRNNDVWGYVALSRLREEEKVHKALFGQADNPLAELLVGGLQEVLRHCEYVTLRGNLFPDHFDLDVSVPHDPANIAESRQYWFGPDGVGSADPLPQLEDQIFGLTAYRNISEMWLRAGDLFDERMNDKLAEADNNLTTLFSGKDFGEDVLGTFHPQVQLIVTRQTFPREGVKPAIKLPAFGLLTHMRDPETSHRELRRTYQSLIGFLNIVGAQNGQPQLELNFDTQDGTEVISASYVPESGSEKSDAAPINFNFSPSVAFLGDRFVVASTEQLARSLIKSEPRAGDQGGNPVSNTRAEISSHGVKQSLTDNRAQLIAQNMLEKGHTKAEAETEIDTLLEILGLINGVDLNLSTDTEAKTFDLHLEVH